ncbi:hypothetical protein PR048_014402 [Dryococelus australis]|uniref:Uncharacterized protein n=1 Tax=Dryococelus australis TaxID=614101 RepID=A0ABQ9HEI6_9NEOP|nr:hypothetical protein PR048_014402 [Dryococelus australis]
MEEMEAFVDRLVVKTPRLITNKTINSAEFHLSLLAECNVVKRGLFQRRCYIAGLQHSQGHSWKLSSFKPLTGRHPGRTHKMLFRREMQRHEAVKSRRLVNPSKKLTKRHKILAPPVEDYGSNVLVPEDTEALQQKMQAFR